METRVLVCLFGCLTAFIGLVFVGSLVGYIWTRTSQYRGSDDAQRISEMTDVDYKLLRDQILSESGFDHHLSISLDDSKSYEWKALQWMILKDSGAAADLQPHVLQRFAIVTTFLTFVLDVSTNHECDWANVQCNGQRTIVSIDLQDQALDGTIPRAMTFLSGLEILDFTDQGLQGRLPSPHLWTNLREVRLSGNQLTSVFSITTENTNNHSWSVFMESMDLSGNDLDETIDDDTSPFASWINLRYLDLQGNHHLASSTLLDDVHWGTLQHLSIAETNITGSLPDKADYTQLQLLAAGFAPLMGRLPESLANASNLRILQLGIATSSNLTGTLPQSYQRLTQLEQLSIVRTGITGTLPSSWGTSLTNLRAMDLYENLDLQGSIPDSWKGLTSLEIVRLVETGLSGTVPSFLSQWTRLQSLSLHRTSFIGTVPPEICGLAFLTTMTANCGGDNPAMVCDCCTFCFRPDSV